MTPGYLSLLIQLDNAFQTLANVSVFATPERTPWYCRCDRGDCASSRPPMALRVVFITLFRLLVCAERLFLCVCVYVCLCKETLQQ